MKSSLEDLWPEPRPKMWQKFDIEGMCIRNLFRPDRRGMENSFTTFWGGWGNIRRKLPGNWCNNSWALHHDSASAHASLIVQQFLASTKTTVIPHPPYSPDLTPYDFFLFLKVKLKFKEWLLTALKRSRPNRRMWWRCWREMTSSNASDRGSPTGIALSVQKGTT
jgi:hypothetical protein